MNYKMIAQIILIFSSLSLGGFIIQKVPALSSLPEEEPKKKKETLESKLVKRIGILNRFDNFSYENFLQNFLVKVRTLFMKTDNKPSPQIRKLKKGSQRKRIKEDNNYWDEVKKATRS